MIWIMVALTILNLLAATLAVAVHSIVKHNADAVRTMHDLIGQDVREIRREADRRAGLKRGADGWAYWTGQQLEGRQ
jgi:hypothetical protein